MFMEGGAGTRNSPLLLGEGLGEGSLPIIATRARCELKRNAMWVGWVKVRDPTSDKRGVNLQFITNQPDMISVLTRQF